MVFAFVIAMFACYKRKSTINWNDNYYGTEELDVLNNEALNQKHIPYPMILHFLNLTNAAFLNIFNLIKLKKEDINIKKLIQALYVTLLNHPCLLSQFHNEENGTTFIEYKPNILPRIEVIELNSTDQIDKNNLLFVRRFFPQ